MSAKYSFHLENQDRRRELPTKIIIGRGETETEAHVLLKLFAFALFHRPRLQIEANLHNDNRHKNRNVWNPSKWTKNVYKS